MEGKPARLGLWSSSLVLDRLSNAVHFISVLAVP